MSNKNKPKENFFGIIVILLIILGVFVVFISTYIIYYNFFTKKLYKSFPVDSEGFIEYRVGNLDTLSKIMPKSYLPWYITYGDKLDTISRGAVLFIDGRKVDVLLTGLPIQSELFLESLLLEGEELKKDNDMYMFTQSNIPNCIHKDLMLYCSKYDDLLLLIERDDTSIKQSTKFIKIDNNLYNKSLFYAYFSSEMIDNFKLLKERYNSVGISVKRKGDGLTGIMYGHKASLESSTGSYVGKKREYDFEKSLDSSRLIMALGGVNLHDQINDTFKYYKDTSPYYSLLAKGLINAKVKDIFGSDIDFFNNILTLFSGEYLIALKEDFKNQLSIELIAEKTQSLDHLFET